MISARVSAEDFDTPKKSQHNLINLKFAANKWRKMISYSGHSLRFDATDEDPEERGAPAVMAALLISIPIV